MLRSIHTRQRVAADAAQRAAAVDHLRRGVVRTAGAEIRPPDRRDFDLFHVARLLGAGGRSRARRSLVVAERQQCACPAQARSRRRKTRRSASGTARPPRRACPSTRGCPAASYRMSRTCCSMTRRLLLDDEDFFQPRGETLDDLRIERPGQRELQQPDAVVHAELGQRLARVVIRLAGRDDAEPRVRRRQHDPVEPVRPHVLLRRRRGRS